MQTAAPAAYDRRAAAYDRLIRSRPYNRLAWSTSPEDYARFAATAIASSDGPLLEVGVGSAAATALLHACSGRPTVLVDSSRPMLERAARNIAAATTTTTADGELPSHLRLVQADLFALTLPKGEYTTILGLGLTHLFEDPRELVQTLRAHLAPKGHIHLSGLVPQTRRARRYLNLLHRAGEVALPKTADELHAALGHPEDFSTTGCMAYATLSAR